MIANVGRVHFGAPVKGKSLRTVTAGRICRADGCATVLSIYNESEDCSVHGHGKMKFARDRS